MSRRGGWRPAGPSGSPDHPARLDLCWIRLELVFFDGAARWSRPVRVSWRSRLVPAFGTRPPPAARPVDGQFGLQLGDAPAGGGQLSLVAAGGAGQLPGVEQMLPPPHVDR